MDIEHLISGTDTPLTIGQGIAPLLVADHEDIGFAAQTIDRGLDYFRWVFKKMDWCSCCELDRKLLAAVETMNPDDRHLERVERMLPLDDIKGIITLCAFWDAQDEEPAEAAIWRALGFAYKNRDSLWSRWGWEERQDHIDLMNTLCEPTGPRTKDAEEEDKD